MTVEITTSVEKMTVTPPVDYELRVNGGPWTRFPVDVKLGDSVETRKVRPSTTPTPLGGQDEP